MPKKPPTSADYDAMIDFAGHHPPAHAVPAEASDHAADTRQP
jgi:hypothetical protein